MTPQLQKLAALGAYAVSAGLVALFVFLVWLMWPVHVGGANPTQLAVEVLAVGCPIGLLIAIHLVLAKQLTRRDY